MAPFCRAARLGFRWVYRHQAWACYLAYAGVAWFSPCGGRPRTRAAGRTRRGGHQLRVRAALHHPAGVEHDHLVRGLGGGHPVRDRHGGTAAGQALQRAGQPHLGRRVDRGRRLVEHQQVRVGEVRPRQRDQLPLARRQRLAALADRGVQAGAQPVEPVRQAEVGQRRQQVLVGRVAPAVPDVVAERARRTGTRPAGPARRARAARRTARRSAARRPAGSALGRVHEPGEELGEGRLAGPGLAHDRDPRPGQDRQVDVAQHRRAARVGEPDPSNTTSIGPRGSSTPAPTADGSTASRPAGSATSGSVSSTPSTRRQPATAFCASLSTSVPICTGPTNSGTRNRNATSSAERQLARRRRAARPRPRRRRSRARPRARRRRTPARPASGRAVCGRLVRLDRRVDALAGCGPRPRTPGPLRPRRPTPTPRPAARRPAPGPARTPRTPVAAAAASARTAAGSRPRPAG